MLEGLCGEWYVKFFDGIIDMYDWVFLKRIGGWMGFGRKWVRGMCMCWDILECYVV